MAHGWSGSTKQREDQDELARALAVDHLVGVLEKRTVRMGQLSRDRVTSDEVEGLEGYEQRFETLTLTRASVLAHHSPALSLHLKNRAADLLGLPATVSADIGKAVGAADAPSTVLPGIEGGLSRMLPPRDYECVLVPGGLDDLQAEEAEVAARSEVARVLESEATVAQTLREMLRLSANERLSSTPPGSFALWLERHSTRLSSQASTDGNLRELLASLPPAVSFSCDSASRVDSLTEVETAALRMLETVEARMSQTSTDAETAHRQRAEPLLPHVTPAGVSASESMWKEAQKVFEQKYSTDLSSDVLTTRLEGCYEGVPGERNCLASEEVCPKWASPASLAQYPSLSFHLLGPYCPGEYFTDTYDEHSSFAELLQPHQGYLAAQCLSAVPPPPLSPSRALGTLNPALQAQGRSVAPAQRAAFLNSLAHRSHLEQIDLSKPHTLYVVDKATGAPGESSSRIETLSRVSLLELRSFPVDESPAAMHICGSTDLLKPLPEDSHIWPENLAHTAEVVGVCWDVLARLSGKVWIDATGAPRHSSQTTSSADAAHVQSFLATLPAVRALAPPVLFAQQSEMRSMLAEHALIPTHVAIGLDGAAQLLWADEAAAQTGPHVRKLTTEEKEKLLRVLVCDVSSMMPGRVPALVVQDFLGSGQPVLLLFGPHACVAYPPTLATAEYKAGCQALEYIYLALGILFSLPSSAAEFAQTLACHAQAEASGQATWLRSAMDLPKLPGLAFPHRAGVLLLLVSMVKWERTHKCSIVPIERAADFSAEPARESSPARPSLCERVRALLLQGKTDEATELARTSEDEDKSDEQMPDCAAPLARDPRRLPAWFERIIVHHLGPTALAGQPVNRCAELPSVLNDLLVHFRSLNLHNMAKYEALEQAGTLPAKEQHILAKTRANFLWVQKLRKLGLTAAEIASPFAFRLALANRSARNALNRAPLRADDMPLYLRVYHAMLSCSIDASHWWTPHLLSMRDRTGALDWGRILCGTWASEGSRKSSRVVVVGQTGSANSGRISITAACPDCRAHGLDACLVPYDEAVGALVEAVGPARASEGIYAVVQALERAVTLASDKPRSPQISRAYLEEMQEALMAVGSRVV